MPISIPVTGPGGPTPHCRFCKDKQKGLNLTQQPERFYYELANRSSSDCIPSSNEVEMRWEHSLTIRMIGRMITFGSRSYWIFNGKRGRKSVWKKRKMEWQWNCRIERNGPYRKQADIIRSILNSDMAMFGTAHEKLWWIWDYRHPMEWMIDYDYQGGSCSV